MRILGVRKRPFRVATKISLGYAVQRIPHAACAPKNLESPVCRPIEKTRFGLRSAWLRQS